MGPAAGILARDRSKCLRVLRQIYRVYRHTRLEPKLRRLGRDMAKVLKQ